LAIGAGTIVGAQQESAAAARAAKNEANRETDGRGKSELQQEGEREISA
jgi:hypothetical protein